MKLLSQSNKNYTLEEKEAKEQAEKSLNDLESIQEDAPDWLSDVAREEYERIVPLLQELPIASLDLTLVSTYCQAYADYREANEKLKSEPSVEHTERGSKVSPWFTIKRDSFNIINSVVPKLGMTIDSRLKIFTPKEKDKVEDDPMARFGR